MFDKSFITVSDDQIRLFYFILGHSLDSESVKVKKVGSVEDLLHAIIEKADITDEPQLELFKVDLYQSLCRLPI